MLDACCSFRYVKDFNVFVDQVRTILPFYYILDVLFFLVLAAFGVDNDARGIRRMRKNEEYTEYSRFFVT